MRRYLRKLKGRAIQSVKVLITRQLYSARAKKKAKILLWISERALQVRSSSIMSATRLHLLYTLNRSDELGVACWQTVLGPQKYLQHQLVLHMLLKASWLIKEEAIMAITLESLEKTTMTQNNLTFIGLRKSAHRAIQATASVQERRARAGIISELGLHAPRVTRIDAHIRVLDALEVYDSDFPWLDRIEGVADTAVVHRFLGRIDVRNECWESAWVHFERARGLNTASGQIYVDLAEVALYMSDPLNRIRALVDMRKAANVRVSGYDRLLGMVYMLEANDLDYLLLRGDQASNEVAINIYGAQAKHSIGRNVAPLPELSESCFVIGRDGVSDEVRWSYYYPSLKEHFKAVQISCDPRLEGLFRRSFSGIEFFPVTRNWGRAQIANHENPRDRVPHLELASRLDNGAFDVSAKASEVMFIEDVATRTWLTEHAKGPPENGFSKGATLRPDPERSAFWKVELERRMRDPAKLKVGLIWRSSLIDADRERHYMRLEDFKPLMKHSVEFFSIQHLINDSERMLGNSMGVHFLDGDVDFYNDFEEIAAVTSALDLVIGISTLPYEMAAAVGVEVWLCAISPAGRWLRLGAEGKLNDRLTRNGLVFYPLTEDGYCANRKERVASIISQIEQRLVTQ